MSRIQDFDEFLKAQKADEEAKHSAQQQRLVDARKKYDAFIGDTFRLVKEFHEKIILPRNNSFLVLKKEEKTESTDFSPYVYRANLIPSDFLPPAFYKTDLMSRVDYLNPERITKQDWHANVAFQLSIHIDTDTTSEEPVLKVIMLTWSHVRPEGNSVLPGTISLDYLEEIRTPFTKATIIIDYANPEQTITEIENMLMLFTPSVLAHRETVWKK